MRKTGNNTCQICGFGIQQLLPFAVQPWRNGLQTPCKPIGIWPSHQQASAKPVHHDTTTSTGQCHTVIKTTLKILQHLTLTGEMLRRVLQSMCEPIEVLIALTLAVLDLPLQCSPAVDQADQQHRARRRSKFSRCSRRRRTLISSEIGNREVSFVTNAANDRNRTGADGTCHGFIIERPKIFNTAATPTDNQHIALPAITCATNGVGDLLRCALPLYRRRIKHNTNMRGAALQRSQDIAHGCRLQGRHDADATRKNGKGTFDCRIKKSFTLKLLLEPQKLFIQITNTRLSRSFNIKLKITTRLIKRYQRSHFKMLTVFQTPAKKLGAIAEHDATHLCGIIFQGEVDVAGTGVSEVGHFSRYPAKRKRRFKPLTRKPVEHGNRNHRRQWGLNCTREHFF